MKKMFWLKKLRAYRALRAADANAYTSPIPKPTANGIHTPKASGLNTICKNDIRGNSSCIYISFVVYYFYT